MSKWAFIENLVIYVCTASVVLGLYYMSKSFHALWGLAFLIFANYPRSKGDGA